MIAADRDTVDCGMWIVGCGERYNRAVGVGFLVLGAGLLAGDQRLPAILSRLGEEAEVFARMAPDMVAQETLKQRARKMPRRFRPRLGNSAVQPPKPQYRTREIVSEYGYSMFRQAPGVLHEFRQVVSVDGRRIASVEGARRTLSRGLRSEDDRLKKRMLEDFEKHGLTGAAADFGQVILLFGKRRLAEYAFSISGAGRIGADAALILSFQQTGGAGSLLIFDRRSALHQPLEGEIWVRQPDPLPLRIVLRSTRKEADAVIRDEARVDYVVSPHGALAPVSVVHRQLAGDELVVENLFQYSSFRKFSSETEVKFD